MGQHKCENCGKEIHWKTRKERARLANGWRGTGGGVISKYGRFFDRRGLRWWCPTNECVRARLKADIDMLFSDSPQHIKDFLLAEMLLERARQN